MSADGIFWVEFSDRLLHVVAFAKSEEGAAAILMPPCTVPHQPITISTLGFEGRALQLYEVTPAIPDDSCPRCVEGVQAAPYTPSLTPREKVGLTRAGDEGIAVVGNPGWQRRLLAQWLRDNSTRLGSIVRAAESRSERLVDAHDGDYRRARRIYAARMKAALAVVSAPITEDEWEKA